MVSRNEKWGWISDSFSHWFLCLDDSNDYENEIKSNSNKNEISSISDIWIHRNYEVFWLFNANYFSKIKKPKMFSIKLFLKINFYFDFMKTVNCKFKLYNVN